MRTEIEIRNNNSSKKYDLASFNKDALVIGRSHDCDIVVDNNKVSGHHGCFYKQGDGWYYQDMNSTNGSIINGFPVVTTPLMNGSRLVLDSKQWPDSCCISVNIIEENYYNNNQYMNQPGYGTVTVQQNSSYPNYQNNMNGSGYVNRGNGYNSGYTGRAQYGGVGYNSLGMNTWGYVAAAAWAVVGIVALVNFIRSLSILGLADGMMESEGGFIVLMVYLMYVITALGTIILPITMFTINKKGMATASDMIAAGYTGIFITIFILIAIVAGEFFGYLFQSAYFVMILASMVLYIAGLISLSRCFKKNYRRQYIYNSYITPIICISIAWVLIFIVMASLSKDFNDIFGSEFSIFSTIPNGSIWLSAIWYAAIIFSCVYLHVDEITNMPENHQQMPGNMGGRYY